MIELIRDLGYTPIPATGFPKGWVGVTERDARKKAPDGQFVTILNLDLRTPQQKKHQPKIQESKITRVVMDSANIKKDQVTSVPEDMMGMRAAYARQLLPSGVYSVVMLPPTENLANDPKVVIEIMKHAKIALLTGGEDPGKIRGVEVPLFPGWKEFGNVDPLRDEVNSAMVDGIYSSDIFFHGTCRGAEVFSPTMLQPASPWHKPQEGEQETYNTVARLPGVQIFPKLSVEKAEVWTNHHLSIRDFSEEMRENNFHPLFVDSQDGSIAIGIRQGKNGITGILTQDHFERMPNHPDGRILLEWSRAAINNYLNS